MQCKKNKNKWVFFLVLILIFNLTVNFKTAESAETTGVFKGYFNNVDYSKPEIYTISGEQTKITKEIQDIADKFNNNRDISTIKEIYQWMRKELKYGEGEKFRRTSEEIFESRVVTGCTDNGLAFIALTRAKGIPSVFIQTGRIDWIEKLVKNSPDAGYITGHILVEVFIDGKWYLVDSTSGKLFINYDRNNLSLCDGYYVFAKSIEVWDSGVKNESENHGAMTLVFKNFDIKKYINPKYEYIDLISGAQLKSGDFIGESTVIGSMAAIIGLKEPVETFDEKYTRSISNNKKVLGSTTGAKMDEVTSSARIIFLYSTDVPSNIPNYFKELIPELNNTSKEILMNVLRNGRRIILIKTPTASALMAKINSLPADFLDKDYPFTASEVTKMDVKPQGNKINKGQVIRVDFPKSISASYINSSTVFIKDQQGKVVSCDIALGTKFIFIQPNINDLAKTYTLTIKAKGKKAGFPITKDFTWKFTVQSGQPGITNLSAK